MLTFAAVVIGALWGAYTARKRGGQGLDMLQYGLGYGLFFGVIGMLLSILILRLG